MLQRNTTTVVQYVHAGGARRSIRRRDDGLYQIWEDNVLEGLGEEYDDRPVAGLFDTLAEAQTRFLRSNRGFELESQEAEDLLRACHRQQELDMSAFSFVDKMTANGPPIRVRALLSFLSTEEGGRQSPAFSGYRPNHNFGKASGREFYVGQITFARSASILPGESKEVDIEFLNGPGLMDALRSGRPWRIQEGPKLVATATLIEILTQPQQSTPWAG